jgi:NAD(P)-dependent dehydrogenase (short-subunit alcohol dehydrogenase family)
VGTARFDFTDQVVIVTGASKGLGRAIALGFAAAGARVVVSSRDQARCEEVAGEARASGGEAQAIAAHTGRAADTTALVENTLQRYGRIDVLVNNAATNPAVIPLLESTDALAEKVFAVNVLGPLRLACAVATSMMGTGGGSVLNIVSKAAMAPEPKLGIYAASKSALVTLTKAMALEWAEHGVRVNAIAPGPFATVMVRELFADPVYGPALIAATAQRRIAEPDEIVGAALYLASEQASFVTGAVLSVDGGMIP